jgi:small subunit ribosomal protein S17
MRRRIIGTVKSDKMAKTRRVEVPRSYRHPKYGKIMRTKTICYVHDEENKTHVGDLVEIIECRPLSRLKRWSLVRVLKVGGAVADQAADVVETADGEPAEVETSEVKA